MSYKLHSFKFIVHITMSQLNWPQYSNLFDTIFFNLIREKPSGNEVKQYITD